MIVTAMVASNQAGDPQRTLAQQHAASIAEASAKSETDKEMAVINACYAAQEAVTPQLLSPGSAKFPDCVWNPSQYEIRFPPSGGIVYVVGYVDSQNGFGALLRTKFAVELSFTPGLPDRGYKVVASSLE